MSQLEDKQRELILFHQFCYIQAANRMEEVHPHWGGQCPSLSTNSDVNLIKKHHHPHTSRMPSDQYLAPHDQVKHIKLTITPLSLKQQPTIFVHIILLLFELRLCIY